MLAMLGRETGPLRNMEGFGTARAAVVRSMVRVFFEDDGENGDKTGARARSHPREVVLSGEERLEDKRKRNSKRRVQDESPGRGVRCYTNPFLS